jgi:hypothetical protein
MSKTSAKNKYEQLMEWLPTLGRSRQPKAQSSTKFSKADHYKKQGAYGKASN